MAGLSLRVREVALFTRAMRFAHPFRFGVARVEAAPQAFVRVVVEGPDGRKAGGAAAEMMMPKWFDKDPGRSVAQTIADLGASLLHAAGLYREIGADAGVPFALHAAAYAEQTEWARAEGLPALVGAYGPAVIDRAILDGALRLAGVDLAQGLRANLPGLDGRLTPDLTDDAIAAFLAQIRPLGHVALRHTVGLADALEGEGGLDGLLARAPLRFFKIKLGGDVEADRARLAAILRVLARRAPDFQASLDANEGYDADRLAVLAEALREDPALAARLLYVEQPLERAATFEAPLGPVADALPIIVDEADGDYAAFPRAAALGYRGVSAKGCKGLYKAILNAARAATWNRDGFPSPLRGGAGVGVGTWAKAHGEDAGHSRPSGPRPDPHPSRASARPTFPARGKADRFFVTAEDLTCQAGLAVQQDTALAACLGLAHAERNGHHYVAEFGPAPAAEAAGFRAAHPEFYWAFPGAPAFDGALPTTSLFGRPGFAAGAEPDWRAMAPLTSQDIPQEIAS